MFFRKFTSPNSHDFLSKRMPHEFTERELEAYLDEGLIPEEMASIESAMRDDATVAQQLMSIISRRDAGVHTVGEIWQRHRISCPTREQLGSFLLKAINKNLENYISFHIEDVGCRFCRANLEDLRCQQEEADEAVATRRKKYYDSSAGLLGSDD